MNNDKNELKQRVHKIAGNGYWTVCNRRIDPPYKIGSSNDAEVTCKVCLAGGMSNFRLQRKSEVEFKDNELITMTEPTIEQTMHRMKVFKARLLLLLKDNPDAHLDQILFYEKEIAIMEVEIAVDDLMCSAEPAKKPWTVLTDSWLTVKQLCREENVVFMDIKWSWKSFRFMWYLEYHTKNRY